MGHLDPDPGKTDDEGTGQHLKNCFVVGNDLEHGIE